MSKNNYSKWTIGNNNQFIPTLETQTTKKLVPGKYSIRWNPDLGMYIFQKEELKLDELLELPNNVFTEVLNDINYFWENKKLFDKYRFTYKRGILLWGNPGCGKTSLTALLSQQVINKGGIVISINNYNDLESYVSNIPNVFRKIEPNTPLLNIFEDLDGLVKSSEIETLLLNVLDGFGQNDNVVNIACTNYPENLKDRILNRPSRFDKRYYIGLPDASVRKFYFESKIFKEDIEKMGGNDFIDNIVSQTEGLTIAHLGEFVKSVFIFGNDIDSTISLLKGMNKIISSSKNDGIKHVGFNTTKCVER